MSHNPQEFHPRRPVKYHRYTVRGAQLSRDALCHYSPPVITKNHKNPQKSPRIPNNPQDIPRDLWSPKKKWGLFTFGSPSLRLGFPFGFGRRLHGRFFGLDLVFPPPSNEKCAQVKVEISWIFPRSFGVKIPKIFELPPSSYRFFIGKSNDFLKLERIQTKYVVVTGKINISLLYWEHLPIGCKWLATMVIGSPLSRLNGSQMAVTACLLIGMILQLAALKRNITHF